MGWAAHLAGLDKAELREWIEMLDEEEPDLEILCKAFDWMIQDAQYVTVQEVVSQAALFEANRKDAIRVKIYCKRISTIVPLGLLK